MSGHSETSPSGRHRWGKCPASVRESRGLPDVSGPAAVDGSHTHKMLELAILAGGAIPAVGETIKYESDGEQFTFTVDQARYERVEFCVNYIAQRLAELPGAMLYAERRVDPYYLTGIEGLDGTVDITIIHNNFFELVDLKDGMGEVEADGNPQLEMYGLGVFSEGCAAGLMYTNCRITILQPKLREFNQTGIKSWDIETNHFQTVINNVRQEIAAVKDPLAPYVPGDSQCKYCLAKGNCNAMANKVMENSGVTFQDLSHKAAAINPNSLTNDQIRRFMEGAGLLKILQQGIEEEALRRFKMGQKIPGLKAVMSSNGRDNWKLDNNAMIDKLRKMGVPKDDASKQVVLTPKQAKNVRWKNKQGEEKRLSERQISTLEKDYIERSTGTMIVVPEDDSRKAVMVAPENMFENKELSPVVPSWLIGG